MKGSRAAQDTLDALDALDARRWKAARDHWNEFGPEDGFGELMDRLQGEHHD